MQVALSANPTLFLHFTTDDANPQMSSHRGFKARWKGVFCYGTKLLTTPSGTLDDGSFETDRYYPRTNCTWVIQPVESSFTSKDQATGQHVHVCSRCNHARVRSRYWRLRLRGSISCTTRSQFMTVRGSRCDVALMWF